MSNDTLETVDGYVEERDPETLVLVRNSGNRYHELDKYGNVACWLEFDRSELKDWTLEHAIHNWKEPCQHDSCKRRRKERTDAEQTSIQNEYPEHNPPTLFFEPNGQWDQQAQLERAYWVYYWSIAEIARWLGKSNSTIRHAMTAADVPIRDAGDAGRIGHMRSTDVPLQEIGQDFPHPEWDESRYKVKQGADTLSWSDMETVQ